jgi:hypothetical protein
MKNLSNVFWWKRVSELPSGSDAKKGQESNFAL